MSIELAKAFIKRMKTDEGFAQKATECRDAKAWMTFAKEAGFDSTFDDVTVDDIKEAIKELNDEEFDGVVGGGHVL